MAARITPALIALLLTTLAQGCAVGGPPVAAETPPTGTSGGFLPARCEQRKDDLYEMRVASVIEMVGNRHVLTVACEGTHRIYLRPSTSIDFARLVGQRVCVRYRYVEEIIPRAPCVRAPCPDAIEQVLEIVDVRPASDASRAGCGNP